jgi:hypothetical protein
VDNRAPATSGSATLLLREAEPGTGSVQRLDPRVLRAGAHWYLKDSFTGTAAKVALRKQIPGRPWSTF